MTLDDTFQPESTITCPECGGTAHLVEPADPSQVRPGDLVVYRCEDCGARIDITFEPEA